MLNYKKIFILLAFCSSLFGQSVINGYGLGIKNYILDTATLGLSSSGLVPSFGRQVALQNPSTWHNLKYTYFSGSYQGSIVDIIDGVQNGIAMLGNAQFIIPIKNMYSIGIGITPYYEQYLELKGNSKTDFIAYNDTLTAYSSHGSFGGTNEFNISLGGVVVNHLNVGLKLGLLYGSNRQQDIYSIDSLDYYSQQRYLFSGSNLDIFTNSDILNRYNIPITLYLGYSFPIKSITATAAYYKPFEDSDESGYQNADDFPSSYIASDPTEETIKNISAPFEYQLGLDYKINNRISILGEYSYWFDKEEGGVNISEFKDQVKSIQHMNIGLAKFAPQIIKKPIDRFNFKIGTYLQNIELLNAQKMIKEYGVSTGVSFNFGVTNNQIDLAYSYGKRQGLVGVGDENIQRYSIGITVGDIWFVKRRAR